MGQFKPMVKMMTTEPSIELKLKAGGHVSMKHGKGKHGHQSMKSVEHKMDGGVMGALSRAPSIARPAMPVPPAARAMARKRPAVVGRPMMKEGGETAAMHKAEMKKMGKIEGELKAHEQKPASKAHAGLKTGGIPKSQARCVQDRRRGEWPGWLQRRRHHQDDGQQDHESGRGEA